MSIPSLGSFGPSQLPFDDSSLRSTIDPSLIERASSGNEDELKNAFRKFVGTTFFGQMLASMRETTDKPAYFHGGQAEEIFREQLDQVLVDEITESSALKLPIRCTNYSTLVANGKTMSNSLDETWFAQVDLYFDRVGSTVDRLSLQLSEISQNTGRTDADKHKELVESVTKSVEELQRLLDQRRELLAVFAADDPRRVSLREALRKSHQPERFAYAQQLADRIEEVRLETLSLFVVQFQMFETSKQILRCIMQPETDPGGYGQRAITTGGGLLDEAA